MYKIAKQKDFNLKEKYRSGRSPFPGPTVFLDHIYCFTNCGKIGILYICRQMGLVIDFAAYQDEGV